MVAPGGNSSTFGASPLRTLSATAVMSAIVTPSTCTPTRSVAESGVASFIFLLYAPKKGVSRASTSGLANNFAERVTLSSTVPHLVSATTLRALMAV